MLETHQLNKEPVDCKKIAADSISYNPHVAFKFQLEAVQACFKVTAPLFDSGSD